MLINTVKYYSEKELSEQLEYIINSVMTSLTISYLIGGLIINFKIRKNKSKAKSLFRNFIKGITEVNYGQLVKCSFYGGEEYENLILNNDSMSKIIIDNESNLDIPDVTIKKCLLLRYKKTIVYRVWVLLKEIFGS
jgi:hypothetical protein